MDALERIYELVLVGRYPVVPVELPEGAGTEDSTHLHIFICWWEIHSLRHVLGVEKTDEIIEVLVERGVYRWVYRTIRDDKEQLDMLFSASDLPCPIPPIDPP